MPYFSILPFVITFHLVLVDAADLPGLRWPPLADAAAPTRASLLVLLAASGGAPGL